MRENAFESEADAIRELAKQPCIIIGRCASEFLKDKSNVINIYVCADKEDRIKRIMKPVSYTHLDVYKRQAQNVPICQDTGMACVFLEIGQDVHIAGGDLAEAVNEGVRRGYDKGYLRKSVVKDPVRRGNTGDNTPAMLYTEIVPGDQIKVTVGPKGFGSENMSMILSLIHI